MNKRTPSIESEDIYKQKTAKRKSKQKLKKKIQ